MEMNETRQNCEEKPDRQIIRKNEQRCVNDSDCCRRCDQVSQKASSHFLPTPGDIGILPSGSIRHRGGVNICDTGNFFHSPQDSGEVVSIVVCQLL
jgi:hypothetical protein